MAGPLFYTVWLRDRPVSSLGLRADNLRPTAGLALLYAVAFGLARNLLLVAGTPAPAAQAPCGGGAAGTDRPVHGPQTMTS